MSNNTIKRELDSLPDIACEKEDIVSNMEDEAEFSRKWINDCLLRQYAKKTGNNRLDARTRKLIKVKSYMTHSALNKKLQSDLQKKAKKLLSGIEERS